MSAYWHQWHWWYAPFTVAFSWAWCRFLNWIVRPDGRWRWQKDPVLSPRSGR
jgi:hypothetical protein